VLQVRLRVHDQHERLCEYASAGARLAYAVAKRRLEVAFGIFLLIVSLRFFFSLVP